METNISTFISSFEKGEFGEVLASFKTLNREEQIAALSPFLSPYKGLKFLHGYFKKPDNANTFWINLFASIDYKLLISAIRVNRAFIGSHFDTLLSLANHPELYVHRHYITFCQLQKLERELFDSASSGIATLPDVSYEEWLWHIAFWLEFNKAYLWVRDPSGLEHPKLQQHLVSTINHFLSYLLTGKSGHSLTLSVDESKKLTARMFSFYRERINEDSTGIYFEVLDAWYNWYNFTSTCLDTYCFDLNFEVDIKDNKVILFAKDVNKFYQWKDIDEKLHIWLSEHGNLSASTLHEKFGNKTGERPYSNIDDEIDKRIIEAQMVADFYYLYPSKDFPIGELLQTWHGITGSSLEKYVVPLDILHQTHPPERWIVNILQTCMAETILPVISISMENLKYIVSKVEQEKTDKEVFRFIKRVIVQPGESLKPINYNRFNPHIRLFRKPLLGLGDRLYYLPAIFGETSTGIGLTENLLAQMSYAQMKYDDKTLPHYIRNTHAPLATVARNQAHKMEEVIAGRFSSKGFKNVAYSREYGVNKNIAEGEFDCLVYESGVLLIIEIKRTQLRVTLEEAWNEKMNILSKATEQLDRGIAFIRDSFGWLQDVFPDMKETFVELEINTLIVSTSFEHDHELMNDRHLKVSLYEFDKTQELIETGKIRESGKNPVTGFYDMLRNNEFWKGLPKHLSEEKPFIELPLK